MEGAEGNLGGAAAESNEPGEQGVSTLGSWSGGRRTKSPRFLSFAACTVNTYLVLSRICESNVCAFGTPGRDRPEGRTGPRGLTQVPAQMGAEAEGSVVPRPHPGPGSPMRSQAADGALGSSGGSPHTV